MTDDREQIAQLQEAWMQAWIDRDVATCERLLAPEFRLRSVATDDIVDRGDWLREVDAGRVVGTTFTYDEMDVAVIGDTAVTMSRITQQAQIEGRDWSATLHVTDVWARGDGGWRVVARHASVPVGRGGGMSAEG
jgi:ketosteroid isomerase-like protein